jgi:ubiquitin-like modifier-activating enzyme ATG7
MSSEDALLRFVPFASRVEPAFWHALTEKKIGEFKLDASDKAIRARVVIGAERPQTIVRADAFDAPEGEEGWAKEVDHVTIGGILRNTNTIEEFKALDKTKWLDEVNAGVRAPSLLVVCL